MKERVCVLMATYNPQKYLLEQINSILQQEKVEVEIIIRDDGSSDKTYLNQIKHIPNITVIEGENLGVANNIMTLIRYAYENKKDYKYFAYSDQDDFWLSDKLMVGIEHIKEYNKKQPNLYYSNLQVVDRELNPTHMLFKKRVVKSCKGQSLAQVFCFACTTIFNYTMVEELIHYDIEDMGFDSLIYYIAIFLGNAFYDDNSYILYRQHGENVSGQHYNGIKKIKARIFQIIHFKEMESPFEYNANYLLSHMSEKLSVDDKRLIETVAFYKKSIKNKLKLLFDNDIKAGYNPKNFQCLLRILVNKY